MMISPARGRPQARGRD